MVYQIVLNSLQKNSLNFQIILWSLLVSKIQFLLEEKDCSLRPWSDWWLNLRSSEIMLIVLPEIQTAHTWQVTLTTTSRFTGDNIRETRWCAAYIWGADGTQLRSQAAACWCVWKVQCDYSWHINSIHNWDRGQEDFCRQNKWDRRESGPKCCCVFSTRGKHHGFLQPL